MTYRIVLQRGFNIGIPPALAIIPACIFGQVETAIPAVSADGSFF